MKNVFEFPRQEDWQKKEEEFKKYQENPVSVSDVYKRTPHESMREVSASIGGPAVGLDNIENLLQRTKRFVEMNIGNESEGRGDLNETNQGIEVLRTFYEESQKETPDPKRADWKLAEFVRGRLEEFLRTIEERSKLAGLSQEQLRDFQHDLEVPYDQVKRFKQDIDAFYKDLPIDKKRRDLYNFRKEYPAVFYNQILASIEAKRQLYSQNRPAFDPLVPLSQLRKTK